MCCTGNNFTLVFWIAVDSRLRRARADRLSRSRSRRARPRRKPCACRCSSRRTSSGCAPAYWWRGRGRRGLHAGALQRGLPDAQAPARSGCRCAFVPAVLVVMNIAYSLSAYPVGALSDRIEPRQACCRRRRAADRRRPGARLCRDRWLGCWSAPSFGACTWASPRACWRPSSPTPRRRNCAARRSACSISCRRYRHAGWPASSPGCCGTPMGRRATFLIGAAFAAIALCAFVLIGG